MQHDYEIPVQGIKQNKHWNSMNTHTVLTTPPVSCSKNSLAGQIPLAETKPDINKNTYCDTPFVK